MRLHIDKFIAGAIDWFWRKRSKGLTLIKWSIVVLLGLLAVGWVFDIQIPVNSGTLHILFDSTEEVPAYLMLVGLIVVVMLFVSGFILLFLEEKRLGKKRVFAVELRGLRDTTGEALKDKIPKDIAGRPEQILLNIRRSDGRILDPEDAVNQIVHLPISIGHIEAGVDRSDIKIIAGGLAPVPYSFLMGIMLDDEGSITLMDWDRIGEYWRSLNGDDDGDRFVVSGIDQIGQAEEIVLDISISYPTNISAISQTFVDQPVVSMKLSQFLTDGHWSEKKQSALAQEFFNTMRALCGTSVKRVNLVLAAPNSIVIRFGRIYDKRNLPALTVWQYENGQEPPYPWGVKMPVAGDTVGIVRI